MDEIPTFRHIRELMPPPKKSPCVTSKAGLYVREVRAFAIVQRVGIGREATESPLQVFLLESDAEKALRALLAGAQDAATDKDAASKPFVPPKRLPPLPEDDTDE